MRSAELMVHYAGGVFAEKRSSGIERYSSLQSHRVDFGHGEAVCVSTGPSDGNGEERMAMDASIFRFC